MEVQVEDISRVFSNVAPALKVVSVRQENKVFLKILCQTDHLNQGVWLELTTFHGLHHCDGLIVDGELQRHVVTVTHDALELAFTHEVSAVHQVSQFLHLLSTLTSSMLHKDLLEFVED